MRVHSYSNGGYGITGVNPDGGVMTMPLRLVLTPTANLEAVTKGYVDDAASSFNASTILGTFNSARLPGWSGEEVSSAGGGVFELSATGVTAGTYSKVTVDSKGRVISGGSLTVGDIPSLSWSKVINRPSTLGGYGITDVVSLNGGVMTGALLLSLAPTDSSHLANKAYVDTVIAGSGSSPFVTGDTIYKSTAVTPSGFLRCNGGVVSKTTYAGLYSVLGDTYSAATTQPGSGQPWRQQYDINTTQSGDITGWTTGTSLIGSGKYQAQAVVTKNRVYLLGGLDGGYAYSNSVTTSAINADGTLGSWSVDPQALPNNLASAHPLVTKNRIHLIGGNLGNALSNLVYTAAINPDGTLGVWSVGTPLPVSIVYSQAIVTKNRVYLLGGYISSIYSSAVYTALINADGTLGTWSLDAPLPVAKAYSQAVVTKNRVYLLGGYSISSPSSSVYTAAINTDGTLGSWGLDVSLPAVIEAAQAIVTKSRVYLLGGVSNGSGYSSSVYTASINADGTLGTWTTGTSLPVTLGYSQAVITKNRLHLLGGYVGTAVSSNVYTASISGGLNDYTPYYDGTYTPPGSLVDVNYVMPGSGQPWNQQYDINTTQSGDISGWVNSNNNLPLGNRSNSSVIVTKNRVHVIGGDDGGGSGSSAVIYTSDVNSDGSLGVWYASTPLPAQVTGAAHIVTKNRVYLLGGNTTQPDNVYTAVINPDGTLGTWETRDPLPSIRLYGRAIVTKNRVYLIGNCYDSVVLTASINTDGSLGTWINSNNNLPTWLLCDSMVVVTKNRVHVIGGGTSTNGWSSAVYTAPINLDGTLGVWITSTSLPEPIKAAPYLVTKNRVYLFGGDGSVTKVYSAVINSDGSLGAWEIKPSLSFQSFRGTAVVTKNRVHITGCAYDNVVRTTTISGGLNDYSPYYDGAIQPAALTYTSTDNFNLPDLTTKDKPGSYSYIKY